MKNRQNTNIKNIKTYINNYSNIIVLFLLLLILFIIMFYYIKENMDNENMDNKNNDTVIVPKYCIGFFACCSDILKHVSIYFNNNKKKPEIIDTSQQFSIYKPSHIEGDIMHHFFKKNDINIVYSDDMYYDHVLQFTKYNNLNYAKFTPFIEKYFSPHQDILDIKTKIKNKYNINVDEYCAVYYRGTDKKIETTIGSFDTYIDKMNELLTKEPTIKFIIQSDSKDFIDIVKGKFTNSVSFDEENVPSTSDKGIHNESSPDNNYNIIKNFLAIVYLISKCKYIICSSGNCSIWMMLYRGNSNNVQQFLNNEWY